VITARSTGLTAVIIATGMSIVVARATVVVAAGSGTVIVATRTVMVVVAMSVAIVRGTDVNGTAEINVDNRAAIVPVLINIEG
jgi:hypothetical protein